jgi:hypothetical protein
LFNQVSSRSCPWSDVKEGKLLEEVIEEHIKKDGCFASWITSSHYWFEFLFLSFIVDSMASQNPKDWEFPLSKDLIQLSQPSTSRRRLRDEEGPSKHHVQPRVEADLQQLPLTSLRALQSEARVLVIVLEAEAMLIESHQVVFEGCFENTNVGYMVTCLSDDIGHRLWLQGPLNHLGGERRTIILPKCIIAL